ncbi:divergent polysaccharide deacetylase family protein [Dongia deserti]|uniref:divergent polysaccharide deacetylase family protein n=1 Tax=Dongia deserti TaxID=2268030 RepID=UPI0013C4BCD7|nr:divergent polysaccharide deacetylase family protein [Dongia deserti]
MTRKIRSRSRRRTRRTSRTHVAAGLVALGWLTPSGLGRFAAGILIGLALGVGAAFYLGDFGLPLFEKSAAKVTTLNASPVEKPAQQQAAATPAAPKPAPQVIEPAPVASRASTLGEEAKATPAVAPAALVTSAKPAAAARTALTPTPEPQVATIAPVAPIYTGNDATWVKNAVAFAVPRGRPMIAVVLDDVGVARSHAEMAIDMPAVITLSFMTYADGVANMAARARAKGHELMLHVPMEPLDSDVDAGPQALKVHLSESELKKRLAWGLGRFPGYIGINNHMGSRFTQDERGMRIVLSELKDRGLLFLDSRTIGTSIGDRLAASMGVAHVVRDVFLDDEMDQAAVMKQLAYAERVAASKGHAIAIGHPHPATLAAIRAWMPQAEARGFVLVPLSTVAKLRLGASG